jgi:hypothetical protein
MLFLADQSHPPGLGPDQYAELATLAKSFYASIPADLKIHGEWAAVDRSANYSLVEAPDIDAVRRVQAPFAALTETTIVAVNAIKGWTAS